MVLKFHSSYLMLSVLIYVLEFGLILFQCRPNARSLFALRGAVPTDISHQNFWFLHVRLLCYECTIVVFRMFV